MKKYAVLVVVVSLLVCSAAQGAPPIFKEKKLYGPIPPNGLTLSIGFLDGADLSYLTDHFNEWAVARYGMDTFEELSPAPHGRLTYERPLTPNHFFKGSAGLTYISTSSDGNYVATIDDTTHVPLDIQRTIDVYLLSFEVGFSYYFVPPEPQSFSPFVGAGFSAVVPMVRLETKSWTEDGEPFENPGENVEQNSLEAGLHLELGLSYFITNRFAAGLEGKYQMAQSKFEIHGGNFDLSYTGFILSLNLTYYL
jgi:hypothetical protein